jgi:hypothetical protein
VFWPALGTMRSKYIPEQTRATIMNFFRVPLNAIVVIILCNVITPFLFVLSFEISNFLLNPFFLIFKIVVLKVGALSTEQVFSACFIFLLLTALSQQMLFNSVNNMSTSSSEKELDGTTMKDKAGPKKEKCKRKEEKKAMLNEYVK